MGMGHSDGMDVIEGRAIGVEAEKLQVKGIIQRELSQYTNDQLNDLLVQEARDSQAFMQWAEQQFHFPHPSVMFSSLVIEAARSILASRKPQG